MKVAIYVPILETLNIPPYPVTGWIICPKMGRPVLALHDIGHPHATASKFV